MAGTKIFVRFSQVSALEHVRFRQVLLYIDVFTFAIRKNSLQKYNRRFYIRINFAWSLEIASSSSILRYVVKTPSTSTADFKLSESTPLYSSQSYATQ